MYSISWFYEMSSVFLKKTKLFYVILSYLFQKNEYFLVVFHNKRSMV